MNNSLQRLKLVAAMLLIGIAVQAQKNVTHWKDSLNSTVFSLTMVMMHDVVNPPAATRFYTYCMMPAYEIVSQNDPSLVPLNKFVRAYDQPEAFSKEAYDYEIAALYSILEAGKQLLPSGYMLGPQQEKMLQHFKKRKVPDTRIRASVKVAEAAVAHVLRHSRSDNYNMLSTHQRYRPSKTDSAWYPTPPAYMEAVEPHWRIIRTVIIDSARQFLPKPLVPFSTDSASTFYKLAKEVYDVSKNMDAEHALIAGYWDCNPFVVATSGHMSLGFKKISPGGHWMNISGIAAKTAGLSFNETIVAQILTACTLMDAFISCWDEKYRSNRIRPETFINRYIDPRWQPVLQTPPFPEYTSGHSVISTAAAALLTYLLGDNFSFTDDTELMFELPRRNFNSFRQASEEAAISRLYGGIHYRDSIVYGQEQGEELAGKIVEVLKAAGLEPLRGKE